MCPVKDLAECQLSGFITISLKKLQGNERAQLLEKSYFGTEV
jgi:hypothetical protein